MKFYGSKGAGPCGIDIPHHDDQIGLFTKQNFFKFDQYPARRDFPNRSPDGRPAPAVADHGKRGHADIVILSRMHEKRANPAAFLML